MSDKAPPSLEEILKLCEEAGPGPWYPSEYVKETGVSRDDLDGPLTDLRMAGLLEFSDWVSGKGQGYVLTARGREVLSSPSLLAKLSRGVDRVARSGPDPDEDQHDPHRTGFTRWDRGEAIRKSLLDRTKPKVVPVLIAINVLVFGYGLVKALAANIPLNEFLFRSNAVVLQATGAITGAHLLQGEWWRLVTSCFVHIGLMHLFVNMLSLFLIGPLAEQLWGRWRFAVIYMLAGVSGSWAAMMYNPNVLLAGASGAIWGVMASLLAWVLLNRDHLPAPLISMWLRQIGGVLLLNVFISFLPGISAAGHFGGGAVGFIVASLLNLHRFGAPSQRWAAVLLIAFIPVAEVMSLKRAMETDPQWGQIRQVGRVREDVEAQREFREQTVPAAKHIRAEMEKLYDERLEKLINTPPAERDPEEVKAALMAIRAAERHIAGAMTPLKDVLRGQPEVDGEVGRKRASVASYLVAEVRYLDVLNRKLQRGAEWTDSEQAHLRRATRSRQEHLDQWDKFTR